MSEKKDRTGWEKQVDGFNVPHLFVRRNSDCNYDVYIHVTTGQEFSLFRSKPGKKYQYRIFTGIETRKEAVAVAQLAREVLFSIVAQRITEWESGLSPMPR